MSWERARITMEAAAHELLENDEARKAYLDG
jgi:hypothetical protein